MGDRDKKPLIRGEVKGLEKSAYLRQKRLIAEYKFLGKENIKDYFTINPFLDKLVNFKKGDNVFLLEQELQNHFHMLIVKRSRLNFCAKQLGGWHAVEAGMYEHGSLDAFVREFSKNCVNIYQYIII